MVKNQSVVETCLTTLLFTRYLLFQFFTVSNELKRLIKPIYDTDTMLFCLLILGVFFGIQF